jgi:hypothetical protein
MLLETAYFANVASATSTGNAIDALCHQFRVTFRPGFYEWTPKNVFSFEYYPNIISFPYTFELLWNTRHIWDIHSQDVFPLYLDDLYTFRINNRVSETLGITVEMKSTYQVAKFIKQILSFLTYGGSSIVKTLK